jgi:glycosyltransferase involved in cell wall biosynthesis
MPTLIIVPCYNEAARLEPQAFLDFSKKHQHIHFLFVNDGSTDNTTEILNNMAIAAPGSITTHHLQRNSGKAEAVRQGFLRGFAMNPDVIGFLDADLASPLDTIPELETALSMERKDIAMAARVALLGRNIERNPARHYAGRAFATAASMILGLRVYDTQCGAKLFRVTNRLKKVFAAPFTVKWIFDVEILARFIISEKDGEPKVCNICIEYPLRTWIDKKGSKLRLKDFLTSGFDLLKILVLIKRNALPKA